MRRTRWDGEVVGRTDPPGDVLAKRSFLRITNQEKGRTGGRPRRLSIGLRLPTALESCFPEQGRILRLGSSGVKSILKRMSAPAGPAISTVRYLLGFTVRLYHPEF